MNHTEIAIYTHSDWLMFHISNLYMNRFVSDRWPSKAATAALGISVCDDEDWAEIIFIHRLLRKLSNNPKILRIVIKVLFHLYFLFGFLLPQRAIQTPWNVHNELLIWMQLPQSKNNNSKSLVWSSNSTRFRCNKTEKKCTVPVFEHESFWVYAVLPFNSIAIDSFGRRQLHTLNWIGSLLSTWHEHNICFLLAAEHKVKTFFPKTATFQFLSSSPLFGSKSFDMWEKVVNISARLIFGCFFFLLLLYYFM